MKFVGIVRVIARRLRWYTVLLGVLTALAATPLAAIADDEEIVVRSVETDDDAITVMLRLAGDPGDLTTLVDGAPSEFEIRAADPLPVRIVLAVEDSVSLIGSDQAAIAEAVAELLDAVPPSTESALVTYGGGVSTVVEPTEEHEAIVSAIGILQPAGGAALFSGVTESLELLADSPGPALLVLLTYGWDWGALSTAGYDQSLQLVAAQGIPVYVHSLVPGDDDVGYLSAISSDGVIHRGAELSDLAQAVNMLSAPVTDYEVTLARDGIAAGEHILQIEVGDSGTVQASFMVAPPGGTGGAASPLSNAAEKPSNAERTSVVAEPELPKPGDSVAEPPVTRGAPDGVAELVPPLVLIGAAALAAGVAFLRRRRRNRAGSDELADPLEFQPVARHLRGEWLGTSARPAAGAARQWPEVETEEASAPGQRQQQADQVLLLGRPPTEEPVVADPARDPDPLQPSEASGLGEVDDETALLPLPEVRPLGESEWTLPDRLQLLVHIPGMSPGRVPLTEGVVSIGSGSDCRVQVSDDQVAGLQAVISRARHEVILTMFEAPGEAPRRQRVPLRAGSEFRMGSAEFAVARLEAGQNEIAA